MTAANMEAQINKHYDAAVAYYEKRKELFLQQWGKTYKVGFQTVSETFLTDFLFQFEKWSKSVINKINSSGNLSSSYGIKSFSYQGQRISTGLTPEQLNGKTIAEQKRMLAIPLEKALQQYFNKMDLQTTESVKGFIAQHTGSIVQQGFTFGNAKKMIRSDIAFTQGNMKIPNNMELSVEMDTNIQELSGKYNNKEDYEQALLATMKQAGYLSEDRFIGGFSIKNYNKNIAYTHSKALLDEINEKIKIFYGTNPTLPDLTMRYCLSKRIIAITSPTVVGLITNKGLRWMSDILSSDQYIMHLRYNSDKNNFYISNSAIYFAEKNRAKVKYSTWANGQMYGMMAYDLQLKSYTQLYP